MLIYISVILINIFAILTMIYQAKKYIESKEKRSKIYQICFGMICVSIIFFSYIRSKFFIELILVEILLLIYTRYEYNKLKKVM